MRLASRGAGDGGAVATVRLGFADGAGEADLRAGAAALAEAVLCVAGVCCAHVALARAEVSGVRTRETEIRPRMQERGFDAPVIAEGSGHPELEAVVPEIERAVIGSGCGLSAPDTLVYNLAYQLGRRE